MFWFERSVNMHEVQRDLLLRVLDDPRYRFYFASDWVTLPEAEKSPGWSDDGALVVVRRDEESVAAGFIGWGVHRDRDAVNAVNVLLAPEYLASGLGARVLATWLHYALVTRGIRKVEFNCHAENAPAMRLYNRIEAVGGYRVGVRRQHDRLRDGQYHDLVLFEILRSEFHPDNLFARLVVHDPFTSRKE